MSGNVTKMKIGSREFVMKGNCCSFESLILWEKRREKGKVSEIIVLTGK